MDATAETASGSDSNGRGSTALHVLTLSCLALAQPLLDLVGRQPEFLAIRRIGPVELAVLLGALLLLVPLPFLAVALVGRRGAGPMRRIGSAIAIGLLAAPIVLRLESATKLLDGSAAIALSALAAIAAGWSYRRHAAFRSFLTLLSPALAVVPLFFLAQPGVRRAVFPPDAPRALSLTAARTPVFVVIFDELSLAAIVDDAGTVDSARYPNLAKLAGRATWYRNAYTVADTTNVSIPAILTGQLPRAGTLPLLVDHPDNLFTLLGGSYTIRADEPITRLCPPEINAYQPDGPSGAERIAALAPDLAVVWLHLVSPPAYARRLPSISTSWEGFVALPDPAATDARRRGPPKDAADFYELAVDELTQGDRAERFRAFLRAVDPGEERALYVAHVMLPHTPWEHFPSGRLYNPDKGRIPGLDVDTWGNDEGLVRLGEARYLLQVEFVDRLVGEFVSTLEHARLFDKSMIVLVSDHGIGFRPGDRRRGYSPTNAADVVPVPLLIKSPFQRSGEIADERVTTLDILPAVLGRLGVAPPARTASDSAFVRSGAAGPSLRLTTAEHAELLVDVDAIDATKREAARAMRSTLGPASDVYRSGRASPHPELLGRRLDSLTLRDSAVRASLFEPDQWRAHDPRAARVPGFVTGALKTTGAERVDLALVVNRTIVATARSSPSGDQLQQFAAILPEPVLAGAIDGVAIFIIASAGGGHDSEIVLERTSPESRRTFALAKDARGAVTAIVADGRELPLGRRLDGWVESTERRDGSVRITGWAADVTNRKLASEVVAFHRDRPIASGGTWVAKGYVAEGLGEPAYTLSGFQLDAPAASVAGLEAEGVRVFAISDDGNATELGRLFLRLERDGGAEHLVRSDGVRVPVKGGALDGVTEAVEPDAAGTLLKGWCADRSRALPADRVVVTLDDRVVREAAPSEERPDLAPPGGPTLRCGFRLHFDVRPAEALGALESGRARLFGVTSAQTATELRAAPGYGKPAK